MDELAAKPASWVLVVMTGLGGAFALK